MCIYSRLKKERGILERLALGDKDVFKTIFNKYYPQLMLIALKYIKKEEKAEEIVQNLFSEIWLNRKSINFNQPVKLYLLNALKENCQDYLKQEKASRKLSISEYNNQYGQKNTDNGEVVSKELANLIINAIELLPEETQVIFKLNLFDGLNYSDIADVLNVTTDTVESHMGNALKNLKNILKVA